MSTNNSFQVRKVRDFGDIIFDTFFLFFGNFMLFFKIFRRIITPVAIFSVVAILGYAFMSFGWSIVYNKQDVPPLVLAGTALFYIFFLFFTGYSFMNLVVSVFRFIKIKADDPERKISATDLMMDPGSKSISLLGRAMLYVVVVLPILILIISRPVLIGDFVFWILLFLSPLFIYIGIATSLYLVISYEENLGFVDSLKRSMYLVKGRWWLTFLSTLVIVSIVVILAAIVIGTPYIVTVMTEWSLPNNSTNKIRGIVIAVIFFGAVFFVFFVGALIFCLITFVFQSLWYYSLVEDKGC